MKEFQAGFARSSRPVGPSLPHSGLSRRSSRPPLKVLSSCVKVYTGTRTLSEGAGRPGGMRERSVGVPTTGSSGP